MNEPETIWVGRIPGEYGGPAELEVSEDEREGFVEYRRADVLTIDARTVHLDLREIDPKPGTIVTCKLPSGTPQEIVEKLTHFLAKHYPDNRVVVMHEDAEITTEEPE